MSSTDLKTQIENDLVKLQNILGNVAVPDYLPDVLLKLGDLITNNPGCFITVAPKTLKIRDAQDNRLVKVNANFSGLPPDIVKHVGANMRSKDAAYFLLLAVKANDMFDMVKFNYKNSNPKAQEICSITKLKERVAELLKTDHIEVNLGSKTFKIDDVITIPNIPKADLALSYRGKPVIFISHKHGTNNRKSPSDSFRQYSGLSKYSLGDYVNHPEILAFKQELTDRFQEAQINGMTALRKGSYFAKKIDDQELALTAMFGRSYASAQPSIHNVHVILQGDMLLDVSGLGVTLRGSHHTMLNPKLFKTKQIQIDSKYLPHFMVTKSISTNQGHLGTRISIWASNSTITKGLDNYEKFFTQKDYQSFKNVAVKTSS